MYFVLGATARNTGELARVNFKRAVSYFHRLRELIFQYQQETTKFSGEIELDESYFEGTRKQTKFVRKKRMRCRGYNSCFRVTKTW
ncbi:MAG: hypothetical protein ACRC4W_05230 [Treponemataceae bacterium]